jgi:hypothetical protein
MYTITPIKILTETIPGTIFEEEYKTTTINLGIDLYDLYTIIKNDIKDSGPLIGLSYNIFTSGFIKDKNKKSLEKDIEKYYYSQRINNIIKSKKKVKEQFNFKNCLSFTLMYKKYNENHLFNFKLFNNGNINIVGIKEDEDIKFIEQYIYKTFDKYFKDIKVLFRLKTYKYNLDNYTPLSPIRRDNVMLRYKKNKENMRIFIIESRSINNIDIKYKFKLGDKAMITTQSMVLYEDKRIYFYLPALFELLNENMCKKYEFDYDTLYAIDNMILVRSIDRKCYTFLNNTGIIKMTTSKVITHLEKMYNNIKSFIDDYGDKFIVLRE